MTLFFLQRHDNCYFLRNCSFPTSESFSWNMQIDIWTKAQEEPYAYFWSSFSFQVFNSTKILPSLLKVWSLFPYLSETAELNSGQPSQCLQAEGAQVKACLLDPTEAPGIQHLRARKSGTSLVVQWWKLCASSAGEAGSIPDQELRYCMPSAVAKK